METDPHFAVHIVDVDGTVVVAVRGEVDMGSAPQLRAVVVDAVASSPHLTLDLGAVTFMDSSGLAIIATAVRDCGDGGSVTIVDAPGVVNRLLDVTGLGSVVQRRRSADG